MRRKTSTRLKKKYNCFICMQHLKTCISYSVYDTNIVFYNSSKIPHSHHAGTNQNERKISVFACVGTDAGWTTRLEIGWIWIVPNESYLCARSISFLLCLSPSGCTKEHKALLQVFSKVFVCDLHSSSTLLYFCQNMWNVSGAASAYLKVFLLIRIRVHKHSQASEVVHISKYRTCERIKTRRIKMSFSYRKHYAFVSWPTHPSACVLWSTRWPIHHHWGFSFLAHESWSAPASPSPSDDKARNT